MHDLQYLSDIKLDMLDLTSKYTPFMDITNDCICENMNKFFKFIIKLLINLLIILFFCEFLIYYIVIFQCNYKNIESENITDGLKAVILADTHLLGPFKGHPVDKLRREWQMKRSFQTTMQIFNPEVVFILGDVFDEGNWVNDKGFQEYVDRFHTIFSVPDSTRLYAIHGNHDVNFHYSMHPHLVNRFNAAFNTSSVSLIREVVTTVDGRKAINFVTLNSMAMEGDDCNLCYEAKESIKSIKKKLDQLKARDRYTKPFIMQHFPTFRPSDENCLETDSVNSGKFREKWEVLSKEASNFIEKMLDPRGYFSGHSHHYCLHENAAGIKEYTLSSFNWRNGNNPSFMLAIFTPDEYTMSKCDMPKETTVIICYIVGTILSIVFAIIDERVFNYLRRKNSQRKVNKD
ncbi:unnamed protein product [Chironomus riparius]|uniref:Calcineurin-like phosphoesterase domain-containing protein n=1 Tax=Chironomus riparius TaxID=315576 RepID=A0A9N9RRX9_9DIPT|nr:unnamed protein product [Chironomus riparius]